MRDSSRAREAALEAKAQKDISWQSLADRIEKSPVYTAMLLYGYGQATEAEATALADALDLPSEMKAALTRPPYRSPAYAWPPTDPFVYRLYEAIMLYGPVFKDVAHEMFGDGIMSAIDMSVDIKKIEDPEGVPRMVLTLNGKWLSYKKF